jgi:cytochrome c-type biogenesis protein CcsB
MKTWISKLASLRLTVILVLLVSGVLAAATIVESLRGAAAGRAVYTSAVFYGLLALFGLNLIAALIERWPRNRWRVGFALTHASIVLILIGALATLLFKVEGRLPIWEGESSHTLYLAPEGDAGDDAKPLELPFEVRLDSFEIDHYPGTGQPAMFRSRVVMIDAAGGGQTPGVIQMNQPMSHGGYNFFQSSYQIQGGREMTILSVSRDPGEAIVFLGYALLVLGMSTVFATRLAQQRQIEKRATVVPFRNAAGVLFCLLAALPGLARAAAVPDAATVETLRSLPVQSDGRTMPLDTLARNAVWNVTGKRAWPGIDPTAMLLGWTIDPQAWADQPVVGVKSDVAKRIGLPPGTRYASFRDLLQNEKLAEAVNEARAKEAGEAKPSPLEKHVSQLEERLGVLNDALRGTLIRPIPAADPNDAWGTLRGARNPADLVAAKQQLRAAAGAGYPSEAAMAREVLYNRVRPSRLAWWLLVPGALLAALALRRDSKALELGAALFAVAGFAAMTWGLAVRWQIAGRIPASNMYESMLFLGWGVGLFAIISVAMRNRMLVVNAAAMSALAMALVDLLPIDPFVHPMPPVLSGTPWLAIHVPIIMVSYATLTIVTFFAHLVVGVEIFAPQRRDLAERWSQLAYWYIHVGSILLITGILTGSIWAASSWGRYWGWDPKEVWSLVAFLAYMAILHARFDLQIRDFGVAVGSIAAFWAILMTYLGVNFVLASGLHSYGFGSSSLVTAMAAVAAVELIFLGAGWRAVRRRAHAELAAV